MVLCFPKSAHAFSNDLWRQRVTSVKEDRMSLCRVLCLMGSRGNELLAVEEMNGLLVVECSS